MFQYSSDESVRRQQRRADVDHAVVFMVRAAIINVALVMAVGLPTSHWRAVGLAASSVLLTLMTPRP